MTPQGPSQGISISLAIGDASPSRMTSQDSLLHLEPSHHYWEIVPLFTFNGHLLNLQKNSKYTVLIELKIIKGPETISVSDCSRTATVISICEVG